MFSISAKYKNLEGSKGMQFTPRTPQDTQEAPVTSHYLTYSLATQGKYNYIPFLWWVQKVKHFASTN